MILWPLAAALFIGAAFCMDTIQHQARNRATLWHALCAGMLAVVVGILVHEWRGWR